MGGERSARGRPIGGDFHFDLHPGIRESGGNHHRGRPDLAKVLAQNRPALGKVIGPWDDKVTRTTSARVAPACEALTGR